MRGGEQARVWALREQWRDEGKPEYGMLTHIASKVRKIKNGRPTGPHPTRAAITQLLEKIDDDADEWLHGNLLLGGGDAMPAPVMVVNAEPARPPRRDRWAELAQLKVRAGWVTLRNFARAFGMGGRQTEKKATENALKRLRRQSAKLEDHVEGVCRPEKIARLSDLQSAYPGLG